MAVKQKHPRLEISRAKALLRGTTLFADPLRETAFAASGANAECLLL